ncbi:MAG: hypothetical protein CMJ05_06480 [Pelagibacterales bacterium]|nr:hypothetical protein [Pelagibacterales bacterium]|tara:strand:- start:310 stop:678 length:369 start_codon:yes stop_codon:yes gene_type:complete
MSDLIRKYLTIDQKFFKSSSISRTMESKDELYKVLKWWKTLSDSKTIGDLNKINGNTPLIKIKLGSNIYVINADTTQEGTQIFLDNINNPWRLIKNENGIKNKVTNDSDKDPIKGFYMYKIV